MGWLALEAVQEVDPHSITGDLFGARRDRGGVHRQRHARRLPRRPSRRRRRPARALPASTCSSPASACCGSSSSCRAAPATPRPPNAPASAFDGVVELVAGLARARTAGSTPTSTITSSSTSTNRTTSTSARVSLGDWQSSVPSRATLGVRFGFPSCLDRRRGPSCRSQRPSPRSPRPRRRCGRGRRACARTASAPRATHSTPITTWSSRSSSPIGVPTATRRSPMRWDRPPMPASTSTSSPSPPCATGRLAVLDIHGIDEHVELQSIVDGAKTLARFVVDYYGTPRAMNDRSSPPTTRATSSAVGSPRSIDATPRSRSPIASVTAIALGEFVEGQRLPAERELATDARRRPADDPRGAAAAGEPRASIAIHPRAHRGRLRAAVRLVRRPRTRCGHTLLPAWPEFEVLFDFRTLVERTRRLDRGAAPDTARHRGDRRGARRLPLGGRLPRGVARRRRVVAPGDRRGDPQHATCSSSPPSSASRSRSASRPSRTRRRSARRALEQHPALVDAVIAGDAELAARLAAEHFSLTETMFRRGVRHRSKTGGSADEMSGRLVVRRPPGARHDPCAAHAQCVRCPGRSVSCPAIRCGRCWDSVPRRRTSRPFARSSGSRASRFPPSTPAGSPTSSAATSATTTSPVPRGLFALRPRRCR